MSHWLFRVARVLLKWRQRLSVVFFCVYVENEKRGKAAGVRYVDTTDDWRGEGGRVLLFVWSIITGRYLSGCADDCTVHSGD